MTAEDRMTLRDKWKVIRQVRPAYLNASRSQQSRKLDHLEETLGMHRKSIIRRIHSDLERKPRSRQRGRTYGAKVEDALRVISEAFDHICAERITPNLVWMAQQLDAHGELRTTPDLLDDLARISVSTVKRILTRIRQDEPSLRRRRPRPSSFTQGIPMKRIPWNEQMPGHFEVDLVHHCGPSASGEYVCTLQMIDVATGWSERFAVLGRSYRVMEDAFRCILDRLPFPVREIHPDNGSEFLNHHLVAFWKEAVQGVQLSRSRPYHKNDNRIVEQKNATLVRQYLGYDRLDTVQHTLLLNQLYLMMGLYYNLFQPVMRLVEKTWIQDADGRRTSVRPRHDLAQTPLVRLCATDAINQDHRRELLVIRKTINPRELRQQIYNTIDRLLDLPLAQPGQKQNVFETLGFPSVIDLGDDSPVTLSFDRTISLR
jgi:hypothetical protein